MSLHTELVDLHATEVILLAVVTCTISMNHTTLPDVTATARATTVHICFSTIHDTILTGRCLTESLFADTTETISCTITAHCDHAPWALPATVHIGLKRIIPDVIIT